MKKILIVLILFSFISPVSTHTFYKWLDEKGTVNYTDDYESIPPADRGRVETEWVHEEGSVPPKQKITLQQQVGEEARGDIYGQEEAYWTGKVRPWKERLKEATENYEIAQKNFIKKSEDLSQTNFYGRSRSQTKWDVMELNRLNVEKKKYEAQINEAIEAMERISKEAKEARANPDWLK